MALPGTITRHPWIIGFMDRLVNRETLEVKFRTLSETHAFLTREGFSLAWKQEWGPKNGWMLYYHGAAFTGSAKQMVVRVKTHGNKLVPSLGPDRNRRAFKPHACITLQDGIAANPQDDFRYHELGKYNPDGELEPKISDTGDAAADNAWADRTHPLYPGYQASCAANPMGLHGADLMTVNVAIR